MDLDAIFASMHEEASRHQERAGREHYERGLDALQQGRIAEGLQALTAAARVPLLRFPAAARLGRTHLAAGDLQEGIEWLERAAEAPPPSAEEGFALLYDLAGALEQIGETARALAILLELEADAGGYRDVRARIERLTRDVQPGSVTP